MTASDKTAAWETPDARMSQFEFMLNALRLVDGFKTELFTQRTGTPIHLIESALHHAEAQGLIEWDLHHLKPTALGLQYLNNLTTLFLPDDATA
jgi:oxygen-independent coproporphyrinogen-3 oxidase